MKNLKIIATGEFRENVDNGEAAAMVTAGLAVELSGTFPPLEHRDEIPVATRDPKPARLK